MIILAIKGGQIISVGNGTFLLDRVQAAGPGQLNIPVEKIYELGNYKSVASVRDVPDISFSLESFDVSTEVENFLTGGAGNFGTGVDLSTCQPVDIASQFKAGLTTASPYAVINSVALPFYYLESASYKFVYNGNTDSTYTLRGDTIYYNPGAAYVETGTTDGTVGQTLVSAHPAYEAAEANNNRLLSVEVGATRLVFGEDYTETYGTVTAGAAVTTLHITKAQVTGQTIRIMYSSPTALSYLQSVHPDVTVKPAAVRGRDVDIYVGPAGATFDPGSPGDYLQYKLPSVQDVNIDWKVTLDKDYEFGNYHYVTQDFEVPDVTGSITIKPRTTGELQSTLALVQGVSDLTKALGAATAIPLELQVVVRAPGTATVVKRFIVPDARFSLPGFSGKVQAKTTWNMPFTSDLGTLVVADGSGGLM